MSVVLLLGAVIIFALTAFDFSLWQKQRKRELEARKNRNAKVKTKDIAEDNIYPLW